MAEKINLGWLKTNEGEKFAPKTLASQVQTSDGILIEDKIQSDINTLRDEAKNYADGKIAEIPIPDIDGKIETHNVDISAHADIRDLINGLTNRLNALADSDDTTLDQMSEIVEYIKANKNLIDSITTNKVNVSDIVNNLTTSVTNKPLSAAQGVELKALIDTLETNINGAAASSHTHGNITNHGAIGTAANKAVITTTNGVLTTGTVPLASGGTGATTAAEALTNLGLTATAAELNYVGGVTSNIQTQLDNKVSNTRTVNGKALSSDITLSAADIDAYTKAETDALIGGVDLSDIQTQLDEKAENADVGFTRIVTCTSSDGVTYTGATDGVTTLTAGLTIVFISSKTSASTTPTLNINGLGAKNIKRRLSHLSTSTQAGYSTTWLFANKPYLLIYDGTQWIVDGLTKPSAADLYGTLPIDKGGTGATTAEAARTNLGAVGVDEIPTALPNPNALTVNGTTYDGSAVVDITDEITALINEQLGVIENGYY